MMKKNFFIGFMLVAIVLGFSGCQSTSKITERHFVAATNEGFSIEFTEYYKNDKFNGKVIMDRISYGNDLYIINKECEVGQSCVGSFAEFIDGVTNERHNFYWKEADVWNVNCYELGIQLGNELLSNIEFGWCNCSCKQGTGEHFVIFTKTYILDDVGGIGGNTYFARLDEVK